MSNMRPVFTHDNEPYGSAIYSVITRELSLACGSRGIGGADGKHLGLGQLGAAVSFATNAAAAGPAFCYHVGYVGLGCANEKVIRPHAARIVATMTNIKRFIERAKVHLIRQTMGADDSRGPRPGLNHAIAAVRRCTCPQPTAVAFLDILPEAIM